MDELRNILKTWRSLEGANRDAVLATVVHVKGSAYRRPGARMLIIPDGRRVGGISGGCLEGEITRKAWWFTEDGRPQLRVYDTTSDDDAVWEFGLGCNGVVQVLLERTTSAPVSEMLAFLDRGVPCVVATDIRTGERLFVDMAGKRGGTLDHPGIRSQVAEVLKEKKSRLVHCGGADVFVEWIGPPQRLVIFGAGHDAVPVVSMAKELGWHVTVADGRPGYARADRFPGVDSVVVLPCPDLPIDRETAVVMMTHNYPLDARLLPRVLEARPRYLGLLGPRKRADRLFDELGIEMPEFVHAPVGLDVGCDTPAAIALSIVSEVQAALSERSGGMLRHRVGAIHAPVAEVGSHGQMLEAVRPSYCETHV